MSEANDIKELALEGFTVEHNGQLFSRETLKPVIDSPMPSSLELYTLTGFVDYLASGLDSVKKEDVAIVIDDHKTVRLKSKLNERQDRSHYLTSKLMETERFHYGNFYDQEEFIISLSSLFVENESLVKLREFVSNLIINNSLDVSDDGITQSAIVKRGMTSALKDQVDAPVRVKLKPYRTFREVDQPESEFLFRMRAQEGKVPTCALFEADGGTWKMKAMQNIAEYLKKNADGYYIFA